jgi:electron transfer flavoprotein alpha subunit
MVASLYAPKLENKILLVYLEQEQGLLEGVSLELLAKGRELVDQMNKFERSKNWRLSGLLLGDQVERLADQAIACGADQVQLADHPLLRDFTIEAFSRMAFQVILETRPSVFLLGATPNGRDLAGRLAVRLRTGLNADCTGLEMEAAMGVLVCEVSGFGGGVLAMIQMQHHRPQMATVRPGVFSALEANPQRTGKVISVDVDLTPEMVHTRLVERSIGQAVDLRKIPVLVAGGRGMHGDFVTLQRLAGLLGGEVGATRPPVDEGHIERERQIGQTGVVCSPKIAICCGISGAFHFVVGIEKAGTVIAINFDPQASIFESADYCVLGDVHQIIPALIDELKKQGWSASSPEEGQEKVDREAAYA